jgi:N,N'-diacetyllegionaminate synthase
MTESKTIIIAEAGVNHNGSIEMAKRLVDGAVEAGADYVKFQTFVAGSLASAYAGLADYQKKTVKSSSQFEMLKQLELSYEDFSDLKVYCGGCGIKFLSTAFDMESLRFLNELGLDVFKVPSGEITNKPYLKLMASFGKPIILSTGMATMREIEEAVAVFESGGVARNQITVLHCNTEYPTPLRDVNLKAMNSIGDKLKVEVGYSDHTAGITVALAAVARGARVIEKHFTLDRGLPGPDHKASLECADLKLMVEGIREIELCLGGPEKKPSPSESKNLTIARKSIVALRDIKKGERFSEANLTVKRPGSGISPMKWDDVVGQIANRDFTEDELIQL